jgi:hypothetical protein
MDRILQSPVAVITIDVLQIDSDTIVTAFTPAQQTVVTAPALRYSDGLLNTVLEII